MAKLTYEQTAQLAVNNGFNATDLHNLVVCVAIADAESGCRTDADNTGLNSNGTSDYGIWQINTVHNEKLPGQDRFDPNVNAKLMMMISSNGTNWQPWSTYNNGAYQSKVGGVMTALQGKTFTPGKDIGTGAGFGGKAEALASTTDSGTISTITNLFETLTDSGFWYRVCMGIVGSGLLLLGVLGLLIASGGIEKTVSLATKLVPAGKAAKVVGAVT